MTTIKLFYYKATGRGNQIRLAFSAGNVPFVDEYPSGFPPTKAEKEAWQKLGGNTTTNIPMLQIDDKYYSQSSAVLRVAARKANIMPTDEEEVYIADKIIADAEDLRTEAYKSFVVWGAPQEAADAFISKVFPSHAGNLERQLKEAGTDFFIGNTLTVADIAAYDAVVNFGTNRIPGDALEKFQMLQKWVERVEATPGIAKYLSSSEYAGLAKFSAETLGY